MEKCSEIVKPATWEYKGKMHSMISFSFTLFTKVSMDLNPYFNNMTIFWSLILEHMLIYQIFFLWKSAFYHSIKLPFHAEVAEKFLNGI